MKELNSLIVARSLEKEAKPIARKVSDLVIASEKDYQTAATLVGRLKDLAKLAEVEEHKITDPLNDALKAARSHFKPFRTSIALIESDTKQKMSAFLERVEREKQKVLDDFDAGKIKKMSTAIKKQTDLEINTGTSSVRKIKVVEIVDIKLIPRAYMVPDMDRIKQDLKDGKSIPGVREVLKNSIAI